MDDIYQGLDALHEQLKLAHPEIGPATLAFKMSSDRFDVYVAAEINRQNERLWQSRYGLSCPFHTMALLVE